MGREHTLGGKSFILPPAFFDRIIQDIPAATWIRLVESNPSLKEILLEGFSARPHKLAALMKQPQIIARLRRFLQSERAPLEEILDIWGQEQLPVVAFLEMLDRMFLEDNWASIRDFLGPERFFAALFVLGNLEELAVEERVGEEFWERHVEPDLVEILIPVWSLWQELAQEYPQAHEWLEGFAPPQQTLGKSETGKNAPRQCNESRREEERSRKIQQKLEKAHEEQTHLQEQLARYKKENEELRKRVAEWESTFDNRVEEAVDDYRKERFRRYQEVDERPLEEAHGRMEMLLKRAERAFELQRQADEQYGLISSVRQKLIQVELYLKEIERIYADSLVVHAEVAKVKDGLLQERQRLLRLPGIEKVLLPEKAAPEAALGLRKRIRLLAAAPENLPKITKVESLVGRLASLGFIEDPGPLKEDIRIKKRQILETLYACFPSPIRPFSSNRAFRSFDDFVLSGRSKDYDMYIDGYNILLQVQGGKKIVGSSSLAPFREGFIEAVHEKSHLFRKVYLVFDGIEDFRDRRQNLEIIYTDKTRGNTADSIIIQALKKRSDNKALLVTSDQEIIKATESRVFAMVDPRHFYTFVFDASFM